MLAAGKQGTVAPRLSAWASVWRAAYATALSLQTNRQPFEPSPSQ